MAFSDEKRYIQAVDQGDPNVVKSSLSNPSSDQSDGDQKKADRLVHDLKERIRELEEQLEQLNDQMTHEGYQKGLEQGQKEGYDMGYTTGKNQADEELSMEKAALQEQLESQKNEIQKELDFRYEEQISALEPKVLSIIRSLVEKLVGASAINKNTVMHLIRSGLQEVEIHGDIIIKVSSQDLEVVIDNKDTITETLSDKFDVEILKDPKLERNECVIETNMGTIDCSLGVQIQGLLKELELIHNSMVQ